MSTSDGSEFSPSGFWWLSLCDRVSSLVSTRRSWNLWWRIEIKVWKLTLACCHDNLPPGKVEEE